MTLYRRLRFYYQRKPIALNNEQRLELGSILKQRFLEVKASDEMFHKAMIIEDGQELSVNSYPNMYTPLIDDCIKEYVAKAFPPIPEKRVRKRIPIKKDDV
jgi:hypothetical protein